MSKRGPRPRPLAERFWAKVDKSAGPDACWPWRASLNPSTGYGQFTVNGRCLGAHRVAYLLTHGSLPVDLELDHVRVRGCTRRDCCNPAHLEPVTHQTNTLRGDTLAAKHAAKTHCDNGHALTPDNLYPDKRGYRVCRECARQRQRAYYQRCKEEQP